MCQLAARIAAAQLDTCAGLDAAHPAGNHIHADEPDVYWHRVYARENWVGVPQAAAPESSREMLLERAFLNTRCEPLAVEIMETRSITERYSFGGSITVQAAYQAAVEVLFGRLRASAGLTMQLTGQYERSETRTIQINESTNVHTCRQTNYELAGLRRRASGTIEYAGLLIGCETFNFDSPHYGQILEYRCAPSTAWGSAHGWGSIESRWYDPRSQPDCDCDGDGRPDNPPDSDGTGNGDGNNNGSEGGFGCLPVVPTVDKFGGLGEIEIILVGGPILDGTGFDPDCPEQVIPFDGEPIIILLTLPGTGE